MDRSSRWWPSPATPSPSTRRCTATSRQRSIRWSDGQNVVGNELGSDPNIIDIDSTVSDTMVHGNYVDGALTWDPSIADHELPPSLYLWGKPDFFGAKPWPLSGGDVAPGGDTLPAQDRYDSM